MARPKSTLPPWCLQEINEVLELAMETYGATLAELAETRRGFGPRQNVKLLYRARSEPVSLMVAVAAVNMALNSPIACEWRREQKGFPRSDKAVKRWRQILEERYLVPRDPYTVRQWLPIRGTEPVIELLVRLLANRKLLRGRPETANHYLVQTVDRLRDAELQSARFTVSGRTGEIRGLPEPAALGVWADMGPRFRF